MSNKSFSDADVELIKSYRLAGVLDDLDSHKLCAHDGLSLVMCGDPDQHPEAYRYTASQLIKAGCLDRIHPVSPLGGALRLAPYSPANEATPDYDRNLLYDLNLVHEKKGINTVALYVHAPCAIAELAGMNFADVIRYAFAAKSRIKNVIPGVKVAVFCHIDRGGDRKTYFVCRSKWLEYHASPSPASWAEHLKAAYPDRVTIMSSAARA